MICRGKAMIFFVGVEWKVEEGYEGKIADGDAAAL